MENFDFQYKSLEKQDLGSLENFFSRVYKETVQYGSKDFFNWKSFENPFSTGFINAAFSKNLMVSTTSITPKSLFLKQKEVLAAEIGDTYTDESFQRKGLFANLVNRSRAQAQSLGIRLVYGTPNQNSLPGYEKKCDFHVVKSLSVISKTLPLDLSFIRTKLPSPIYILLNSVYTFFLRLFLRIRSQGGEFKSISAFGPHHEELWQKCLSDYDFIFSKNVAALHWRFLKSPYRYSIYDLFYNGTFCGFVVLRVEESTDTLFVADFMCDSRYLSGFQKSFSKLILSALGKSSRMTLWCSQKDFVITAFRSLCFIPRKTVPVIFYKGEGLSGLETLRSFHFSLADSDNI